ncbi:MAG: hypothetical protein OQK61_08995, partial [Ignavibacteriaceae bacterium]|nr:hypothetical protein [Ignavibacteriaceae bacterium]
MTLKTASNTAGQSDSQKASCGIPQEAFFIGGGVMRHNPRKVMPPCEIQTSVSRGDPASMLPESHAGLDPSSILPKSHAGLDP